MEFEEIDIEKWLDLALEYGLKLLGAIVIWIIGSWIISKLLKGIRTVMAKGNYDESLQGFLTNLAGWALKIVLIIVVLGTLGVETTSFAAILAAAGLAIGLALQGSLSNFAGGVLIMIFKPFKVGDLIEAQGEIGGVKEIAIFTTKLTGLSNKEIIIPNGSLSNGNIVNYTVAGTRRVDLVFGVDYAADIKKTKEVLMGVLKAHPLVINDPEPTVNVLELADSSINFAVRPWCASGDYWTVYFDVTENVKEALDAAGIEIPYPHQVEIHKEA
ncbi:mechanosensitive ion channel [Tamlana sp. 2_MG-2023]|uniref:mechanosensitive ion channel family protein n=1 Tax=unclassified Tamlana TaxID=2614803 RepID=UPI0026E40882|nr:MULTISPECIES: mechanosensitive ion channel domain-containing protein [unclassified Tamlana]MDO6761019.1 mechanosensitive ion channel [Tamlana sp. 2_MG-2023]MDO6791648.1 mechanosensitive ion channel [Tamlana sp. 1_MG-2023]